MELHRAAVHQAAQVMHVENRPAAAVRHRQVECLCHVRHLECLGNTAVIDRVRLNHVDRMVDDELSVAPPVPLHLSGGDRYRRLPAKIRESAGVVLLNGLFEPQKVAVLDAPGKHSRVVRVEPAVGIDHQVDVGPYRLACGTNPSHIVFPRAGGLAAHNHLEHLVTVGDELPAVFGELLLVEERIAESRVGGRPVAVAADQLMDRAIFLLAADIPQRDVDGRQRIGNHTGIRAAVQLPPDMRVDLLGVNDVAPFSAGAR